MNLLPLDVFQYLISFTKTDDLISIISLSTKYNKLAKTLLCNKLNIKNNDKSIKELIRLCKFPFDYIHYKEFNSKNLIFGEFVSHVRVNIDRIYNGLNKNYHTIGIKYQSDGLKIIGCKMTLNVFDEYEKLTGIYDIKNFCYDDTCQIYNRMDNEPYDFIRSEINKDNDFVKFMDSVYELCIPILDKYKNFTFMVMFQSDNSRFARATGFRYPLNGSYGSSNYIMYFNLSNDFHKYILYNDEYIDIRLLYDMIVEYIPIVHIKLLCGDECHCLLKIEICGMNILSMRPVPKRIEINSDSQPVYLLSQEINSF